MTRLIYKSHQVIIALSENTKKAACYGRTYASIGIPEKRYDFIHSELQDHFQIPMTINPDSIPKRYAGYV